MSRPIRWRGPLEMAAGLILALTVWFGGRSLGLSDDVRFVGALALALAGMASARLRGVSAAPAVAGRILSAADPDGGGNGELVRQRLHDGLRTTHKAVHRRSRYALPWYLVLGAEGVGKSALLRQCGLSPVSRPEEEGATKGCAVVVTREAVFIDTAGAYCAADTLARVDQTGWDALVDGLARQRPLLPVNGVILAVSPAELAVATAPDRHAQARAIRRRLTETQTLHGAGLPVYLLLSKMDLVPGFVEFFGHIAPEQRDQPWGFSFPAPLAGERSQPVTAEFLQGFDRLVANLADRQLDLLHQESSRSRAGRVLNFAAEVAALKSVVIALLEVVFAPAEKGGEQAAAPLLRGVFLTSSRQDGLTIDPLQSEMSSRFLLARPPLTVSSAGAAGSESRGWFIGRPMRETILAEAGLVCRRGDPYGRRVLLRRLATAATVAVCTCAVAGLALGYRDNLRDLQRIVADMDRQLLDSSPDLGEQTRVLHFLAGLPPLLPKPLALNGVLGDLDRGRALARAILPRLVDQLRQRLADSTLSKGELATDLALMRMLSDETPPDTGMLTIWLDEAVVRMLPATMDNYAAVRRMVVERTAMRLLSPHPPHLLDDDLVTAMESRLETLR